MLMTLPNLDQHFCFSDVGFFWLLIPGGHLLKKLGEWGLKLISLEKVSISKTKLIIVIKHP